MKVRVNPVGKIAGRLHPPPDKSISHRAALVAAMCEGTVDVSNYLDAADTRSTLAAIQALGAGVHGGAITGVGLLGAHQPARTIDVGNAGTLLRLLPGWLSAQDGRRFALDGDESIRRRPVDRIVEPLRAMGARVEAREGRLPPLEIEGTGLHGIRYAPPVASAQVKSCVLLAGLMAVGETVVEEAAASRDHTERMLARAGADVRLSRDGAGRRLVSVAPADRVEIDRIAVPGDFSSAAFALAAAVLLPGSRLTVEGVGVNWTRTGLLRVLERMGARIEGSVEDPDGELDPEEPQSRLVIRGSQLRATTVTAAEVPLLIDELPLVALLGCFAEGETVVEGAGELRVKESDRIATVVEGLAGLGARIEATSDGFVVQGSAGLRGGAIASVGDHRLAMLGAIAGLVSKEGVEVKGMEVAEISYPSFLDDMHKVAR